MRAPKTANERVRIVLISFARSISHGKYFHNRAASSSLPTLDLGLQYKQFWVKWRGGGIVENKLDSAGLTNMEEAGDD